MKRKPITKDASLTVRLLEADKKMIVKKAKKQKVTVTDLIVNAVKEI